MTNFEKRYYSRVNRAAVLGLLAHLPIMVIAAMIFKTSVGLALAASAAITVGPLILLLIVPESTLTAAAIGVAAVSYSGLLIHLGRGMIEMHFHVFAVLAALIILGRATAILAGAITIALHHVLFWLFFPASVFNYHASFAIVLVHAIFVVGESAILIVAVLRIRKFVSVQGVISEKLGATERGIMERSHYLSEVGLLLGEGASQQATALQETTTSLDQISAMTTRNAGRATQSLALAGEARKMADTGAHEIHEMSESMKAIKASGHNIFKIVKSIDEIAFQTNLLSLNAAVEAAIAGEAGRGFAVVAEEVRSLAQRAATSARETAEMIEDSIRKSEQGVAVSERVAASLSGIVKKVREMDQIIREIASGSKEQESGIQQVTTSVAQLDKVTQANADNAHKTASTSAELEEQAGYLREVIAEILVITDLERDRADDSSNTNERNDPQGGADVADPLPTEDPSSVSSRP